MSLLHESGHDDQQLVRYLLGQLPDEDAERLDEMSIADERSPGGCAPSKTTWSTPTCAARSPARSLARFESFYLASPRRREKVEVRRRASSTPSLEPPQAAAGRPRRRRADGPAGNASDACRRPAPGPSDRAGSHRAGAAVEAGLGFGRCRRAAAAALRSAAVPGHAPANRPRRGAERSRGPRTPGAGAGAAAERPGRGARRGRQGAGSRERVVGCRSRSSPPAGQPAHRAPGR